MAQKELLYRALQPCRVGRLRNKGEVFSWPAFIKCPSYLDIVGGSEPVQAKPASVKKKQTRGALPEDFGLCKVVPSSELTSADIIK